MRLLVSWVRDFVDVTAPAAEIAEKLALRGFEVASIEPAGPGDAVIDFEVTANRPDCLSVIGFAREIGTLYDLPVRMPSTIPGTPIELAHVPTGDPDGIRVTLDAPDLCPRYAAAIAHVRDSVTPAWMKERLAAAGLRPIGPIVDITNYVLMELGQPMHAFDLERLDGRELRIRRARAGETITTLDGTSRTLDAEMLVIADQARAQAVAGVMGGAASEVSASTRTIVFESACFAPASVRRTSKRLNLKTEASSRFERGTDVNIPVVALQRAMALMHQIGAGRGAGPLVDRYPRHRDPARLHLRRERLARLLGLQVPDAEVARILTGLGLAVTPADDGWDVLAPTFRVDLLREVDLIEEVGRHHGFEHLEPTFPVMTAAAAPPDPRVARDRQVRHVLSASGLSEAVTFGFIEAKWAETFAPSDDASQVVAVSNPLSAKFDALRPSLLPGLLEAVAHNRRHGRRDVALYEIGARFSAIAGETRGVGLAWTGAAAAEHWSGTYRDVDFFDMKGLVERLADVLGTPVTLESAQVSFLVPGQAARILAHDSPIGVLGRLTPALLERAGAPKQDALLVAELDLDRLAELSIAQEDRVRPLPRHPFIVRDLSIIVGESLPAAIIHGTIQAAARAHAAPLTAIAFFDRYQGKGVPEGSVSLSVRLTFQAADRTLTDAEVQGAFETILSALASRHGAVQR